MNRNEEHEFIARVECTEYLMLELDGFGGLVVSMLASGTQVCGFKPGRNRWIFRVKESVPCPSFAACK